jgi:hypothetical protein
MCRHPERETVGKSSWPGEGEGEGAVTAGIESSVGQSHAAAPLFCASVNECDPEEHCAGQNVRLLLDSFEGTLDLAVQVQLATPETRLGIIFVRITS